MDSKQTLTKELLRLHQQEAELQLSYDQKRFQIRTRIDSVLSKLLPGYSPNKPVIETLKKTPANDSQYIFIANGRKPLNESEQSSDSPCNNCDKHNICEEPCELLKAKLPSIHSGSYLLSNTFGKLIDEISDTSTKATDDNDENLRKFDINYLKAIDRIRADDIFILYKNCIQLFSKIEWRVVTLRIEEGQTFKTTGLAVGISTSTASDTFQRAKRRMERHYQKRRNT